MLFHSALNVHICLESLMSMVLVGIECHLIEARGAGRVTGAFEADRPPGKFKSHFTKT